MSGVFPLVSNQTKPTCHWFPLPQQLTNALQQMSSSCIPSSRIQSATCNDVCHAPWPRPHRVKQRVPCTTLGCTRLCRKSCRKLSHCSMLAFMEMSVGFAKVDFDGKIMENLWISWSLLSKIISSNGNSSVFCWKISGQVWLNDAKPSNLWPPKCCKPRHYGAVYRPWTPGILRSRSGERQKLRMFICVICMLWGWLMLSMVSGS